MSEPLLRAAPAKINLALHVTGRRADGYHLLDSLMAFAGIGDEIEARLAPSDRLTVSGPFGRGLEAGPSNLVSRAVAAFRNRWPDLAPQGLDIVLRKNLPVAAGLGGGSADAAAVLRLLAELSSEPVPREDLTALAAGIGADVPSCLISMPLLASGIGEILRPLRRFPACHVVLVNPLLPVATAEVFRKLARRDNPALPPLPEPMTRPAQLGIFLSETRNDLEDAAIGLVPAIGRLIGRMALMPGCMLARMSGSGATVFGLFGASTQAHQAAHELRAVEPQAWVAAAPLIVPG